MKMQDDDTFYRDIMKLIDEMKVSPLQRYFVKDEKVQCKVEREDDKSFLVLVVPQALIEYVLYHTHDAPGQSGTSRMYQHSKHL